MAVPIDEYLQKGKSIVTTRMKPAILTYLASEDKDRFAHPPKPLISYGSKPLFNTIPTIIGSFDTI